MGLALALFAGSGRAEELILFNESPRPVYATAVERDVNDGGYLVATVAPNSTTGSRHRLRVRRVERSGGAVIRGRAFVVAGVLIRSETDLSFSSDRGLYLSVFVRQAPERPSVYAVYGRLLTAEGRPLGKKFRISPSDGCSIMELYGAAYSPLTGRWLVAWSGAAVNNRVADCERVRARFVRPNGKLGAEIRVSAGGHLRAGGDIAYSTGASQFLVVWADSPQSVYGRRIGERGGGSSPEFLIAYSEDGCALSPRVAGGAAPTGWLVAWQNRCVVYDGSLDSRLVEATGRLRRTRSFRSGVVVATESLAFGDKIGRFLAVWSEIADPESAGAQRAVYSRWVRRSGRAVGPAKAASGRKPYESLYWPRASCAADRSHCLVVWANFSRVFGEFVDQRPGE